MITVSGVSKRYGGSSALEQLTFTAPSGQITGFLGANGAGKSSSIHVLLALTRPDSGRALIDGVRYQDLDAPARTVGALLDRSTVFSHMTAAQHLHVLTRAAGLPHRRGIEALEAVGLSDVANRQIGGFSLGMARRLGIAAALLGDPGTLVLDEPMNGLDPAGLVWMRELLVGLAAEGRTILLSSHLLAEVRSCAQHVVIIDKGRLVAEDEMEVLLQLQGPGVVRFRSPGLKILCRTLGESGAKVEFDAAGGAQASGVTAEQVGDVAARLGVALHELRTDSAGLEEVFLGLTTTASRGRHAGPVGTFR